MIGARFVATLAALVVVDAFGKRPTALHTIKMEPSLTHFYCLAEKDDTAKSRLQFSQVTVFAPRNSAFANFSADQETKDLTSYHLGCYSKTMEELDSEFICSVSNHLPPLWITNQKGTVYINNAKILMEKSNFIAATRNGTRQVVHVVDEVLDPVIRDSSLLSKPSDATDFFKRTTLWDVAPYKVGLFWEKVVFHRKESLYMANGPNTFLVPVDDGFTDHRLQMLDGDVIDAHIIPNYAFFLRPTPKELPFETLTDGKLLYVLVYFVEIKGKTYIKGSTITGNTNIPTGEALVEIVRPNIPVKNGVIHLIKEPLVILYRKMTLFPYLPVIHKLTIDPFLSTSFMLFKETGLLRNLEDETKKFTIFVPRDRAWKEFEGSLNRAVTGLRKELEIIMGRHVVVSNLEFSMEKLKSLTQSEKRAEVELVSLSGVLRVSIRKIRSTYYIIWNNRFVRVFRPDYECTNGMIHIIDQPFVEEDELKQSETEPGLWQMFLNLFH